MMVTSSPGLMERLVQPALVRILGLFVSTPQCNFAVLVFHVQVNLRVGIGPHKLRYGSFNGDSRLLVVC